MFLDLYRVNRYVRYEIGYIVEKYIDNALFNIEIKDSEQILLLKVGDYLDIIKISVNKRGLSEQKYIGAILKGFDIALSTKYSVEVQREKVGV